MFKFIYPMSSSTDRRMVARRRFETMTHEYGISAIRTNLREETFNADLIFKDVESGMQMTERQRVYTFTFYLDDQEAKVFLSKLCTSAHKRARVLTRTSALLLLDDYLAVETNWSPSRGNDAAANDHTVA